MFTHAHLRDAVHDAQCKVREEYRETISQMYKVFDRCSFEKDQLHREIASHQSKIYALSDDNVKLKGYLDGMHETISCYERTMNGIVENCKDGDVLPLVNFLRTRLQDLEEQKSVMVVRLQRMNNPLPLFFADHVQNECNKIRTEYMAVVDMNNQARRNLMWASEEINKLQHENQICELRCDEMAKEVELMEEIMEKAYFTTKTKSQNTLLQAKNISEELEVVSRLISGEISTLKMQQPNAWLVQARKREAGDVKRDLAKLTLEREKLEQNLAQEKPKFDADFKALEEEKSKVAEERAKLITISEGLIKDRSQIIADSEKLAADRKSADKSLHKERKQLSEMRNTIEREKAAMVMARVATDRDKEGVIIAKAALDLEQIKLTKFKESLEAHRENYSQKTGEIEKKILSKVAELAAIHNREKERIFAFVKAELATLRKAKEEIVASTLVRIENMEATVYFASVERDRIKAMVQELKNRPNPEEILTKIKELNDKNQEMLTAGEEMNRELSSCKAEKERLQFEMLVDTRERNLVGDELRLRMAEIDNYKGRASQLTEQNKYLVSRIQDISADNVKLKVEFEVLRTELEQLQRCRPAREAVNQSKADGLLRKNHEMRHQLGAMSLEIITLVEEFEASLAGIKILEEDNLDLRRRLSATQRMLSNYHTDEISVVSMQAAKRKLGVELEYKMEIKMAESEVQTESMDEYDTEDQRGVRLANEREKIKAMWLQGLGKAEMAMEDADTYFKEIGEGVILDCDPEHKERCAFCRQGMIFALQKKAIYLEETLVKKDRQIKNMMTKGVDGYLKQRNFTLQNNVEELVSAERKKFADQLNDVIARFNLNTRKVSGRVSEMVAHLRVTGTLTEEDKKARDEMMRSLEHSLQAGAASSHWIRTVEDAAAAHTYTVNVYPRPRPSPSN